MAINYTVKMKDKKLTEQILKKEFENLGYESKHIETISKGICIDFMEELGFYVYLIDASNYPYNRWTTKFLEEEFVFERTLQFRFDKEFDNLEKRYTVMLSVVFRLLINIKEEALSLIHISEPTRH